MIFTAHFWPRTILISKQETTLMLIRMYQDPIIYTNMFTVVQVSILVQQYSIKQYSSYSFVIFQKVNAATIWYYHSVLLCSKEAAFLTSSEVWSREITTKDIPGATLTSTLYYIGYCDVSPYILFKIEISPYEVKHNTLLNGIKNVNFKINNVGSIRFLWRFFFLRMKWFEILALFTIQQKCRNKSPKMEDISCQNLVVIIICGNICW